MRLKLILSFFIAIACSSKKNLISKSDKLFMEWFIENEFGDTSKINLYKFSSGYNPKPKLKDSAYYLYIPNVDYDYLNKYKNSLPNELKTDLDTIVQNQAELKAVFEQNENIIALDSINLTTNKEINFVGEREVKDPHWYLENKHFYRLSKPMKSKNGKYYFIFISQSTGYESPIGLNIYKKIGASDFEQVGFYSLSI